MAILVTGAAGFVALNVVEHLLEAGRDVVGLDRIPLPRRAARDFASLPGRFTLIGGSILSDADLSRALTMRPIEAVIHCAVITAGARRETSDPGSIVAVNVQGAVGTLVAAARHGVKRFVYPSSGAVYGASAASVDVMDEDTLRPAPVNLYGLTKFAAESILPRIAETQGVSLTAARLGVVYGPWEYATGVRDTLSPMLQTLDLAAAGTEAVLGPPWRGDYTLSRDIAAGLVAIADTTAASQDGLQSRDRSGDHRGGLVPRAGNAPARLPLAPRGGGRGVQRRQPRRLRPWRDGYRQDHRGHDISTGGSTWHARRTTCWHGGRPARTTYHSTAMRRRWVRSRGELPRSSDRVSAAAER